MNEATYIVALRQPDEIDDPLTDILRAGARQLLAQAVEIEVAAFLATLKDMRLADGRARVVRHGYGPSRTIQTGIGPVAVARAKVRDRGALGDGERIRFRSALLPRWARRTRSLDALLPVLYLRGLSTGDFQEALTALLGRDAPNLSPAVISRLTAEWQNEYARWQQRDLAARRYVYVWADGVYLQARMEDHSECMLVLIGATPEGRKELIGFQVGVRESTQSWRELLIDIKQRGLQIAPQMAVGDGALGFWKALDAIFPGTRHQRCWVMAVGNRVTPVPPHRTGRAAFPHPAPTSDSDGEALRPSVRAPASVTRLPGSGSGACVAGSRSPRPPPFAPSPPLPVPRFCSATSPLL